MYYSHKQLLHLQLLQLYRFVALSLSPMLASKFLKQNMYKSKMVLKFEKFLNSLTYHTKYLYWVGLKKTTITIFLFTTLALTLFFFNFTKKELIAPEDRGAFFVIVKLLKALALILQKIELKKLKTFYCLMLVTVTYRKLIMRYQGLVNLQNK